MKYIIIIILMGGFSSGAHSVEMSPYSGEEVRAIKSMSQTEIKGYLNGKGMGFAKAAELNNYPGPKHVLELSKELSLSSKQKSQTDDIFYAMQSDAITLGIELIKLEKNLDSLFLNEEADSIKLETILNKIGIVKTKIRQVHLDAHIKQKNILSSQQILLYSELRGYQRNASVHKKHHH